MYGILEKYQIAICFAAGCHHQADIQNNGLKAKHVNLTQANIT
jgi:hypothetical protein